MKSFNIKKYSVLELQLSVVESVPKEKIYGTFPWHVSMWNDKIYRF